MSLESVVLIGVLTLFTIVLGLDLLSLLIGRSVLEAAGLILLLSAQFRLETIKQPNLVRLSFVLLLLLLGAIALNLTPNARTESYLLRIGLGSFCLYLVLLFVWPLLLWPRALVALVSFWSFLHYAMNPKL